MFKFELENVLELRRHLEVVMRGELGVVENMIKDEVQKKTEILVKKENLHQTMEERFKIGAGAKEYQIYAEFVYQINSDLDEKNWKIIELKKRRDLTREQLMTAVKNRKALEKLKEQRLREYNQKYQKMEMDTIDDFASQQFIRRMDTR
jgi:flagellar protein FliJ